ncbi:FliM/FliN family flagellar motor C-terminal domain-containing protein [Jannaschia sp.]|nr:FliM/FliN family flagellar motor C-terminal domain-containing protein [Jannaschia sp.]
MPSQTSSSAMRRLAGCAPPAAPDAASAPPSPVERALATAAFRVADGLPALGLSVTGRRSGTALAADVFEDLPQMGLCLMVDPVLPPGAGRLAPDALAAVTGVVVLDPSMVDSLVELQTIGRIDGPARAARRPTRIDAALAQPFAAALLEEVLAQLPRDHRGPRPGPMRTGTFLAGTGSLPVALTAQNWLTVTLELALGDGVRPARIDLMLPDTSVAQDEQSQADEIVLPDPDWEDAMDAIARIAPVRLDAVLPPLRLSLADLIALKPGDVIPLTGSPLEELRLLSGASGRGRSGRARMPYGLTISARLGRFGPSRAVRLSVDPGAPVDRLSQGDDDTAGSVAATPDPALAAPPSTLALPGAGVEESSALDPGGTLALADDDLDLSGLPDLLAEGDALDLATLPDLPDLPELPDLD